MKGKHFRCAQSRADSTFNSASTEAKRKSHASLTIHQNSDRTRSKEKTELPSPTGSILSNHFMQNFVSAFLSADRWKFFLKTRIRRQNFKDEKLAPDSNVKKRLLINKKESSSSLVGAGICFHKTKILPSSLKIHFKNSHDSRAFLLAMRRWFSVERNFVYFED